MDAEQVEALIADGESLTVEFKGESRTAFNDRALVEAVVCLANGRGGVLLVGVEDDGTITGARPRHEGTTFPARIQALIANQTVPPVAAEVAVLEVGGKPVLAVTVEDAARVVGTSGGLYVRRALRLDGTPQCIPFLAHEMLAREIDRGSMDYAALPVHGATWDDLDPNEFDRFRTLVSRGGSTADSQLAVLSDTDVARALGVVASVDGTFKPTLGALLLFGRADALLRTVPTHEAAFQVLRGTSVEVNGFLRWPLFRVAEELLARFQVRNTEHELQFGLIRLGVPLVPEVAVREAIANALVHRD